MTATVLGASGFIGRHLVRALQAAGEPVFAPGRGDPEIGRRPLGTVFYCIGLTADFRSRPFDTVEAHVGVLGQVLARGDFEHLVYLSSTRVYARAAAAEETAATPVLSHEADDLYNLSKLMGESLALSCGRRCTAVRLSNVLGPDMGETNFIGSVIAAAARTGSVTFRTAPGSEKDYIFIDDVVAGLMAIARGGQRPVYNLAGGRNISNATIAALLAARGIAVEFEPGAPAVTFPPIHTQALAEDTGFRAAPVEPKLAAWLDTVLQPPSETRP